MPPRDDPFDSRPTADDLRTWAETLEAQWNQGPEAFAPGVEEEEALYFQQRPRDRTVVGLAHLRTGSAPADVDAAVDALVPRFVLVRIPPARKTESAQKQAELLTRAARALLRHWRRDRDVLELLAQDQVLRRVAVARLVYDPTRYDPDDDVPRCPLRLERRPARYVRWHEDSQGHLLCVVERYPTTVLEAHRTLGAYPRAREILRGRRPTEPVTILDVWYGPWRALFLEDQPVFAPASSRAAVLPHGYPSLPYAIAPYRDTGSDVPGTRYRGFLSGARELYQAESEVLTHWLAQLRFNAWTTYVGWTADGREIQIRPGQIIPIDQRLGEYLQPLTPATPPQELLQSAALLESYLQRNAGGQLRPRTLEGARSAQQVWALQSYQDTRLLRARQALQRLCARALRLAFATIEHTIRAPITLPSGEKDQRGEWLGEVRVGPDDIAGYVDEIEVLFGPRLDPAQLEQWKTLSMLAANGFIALRHAWQLSGATDTPSDWWDEIMLENVERLPFLLQLYAYEMVKKWHGEDSWQAQVLRQKLAEEEIGRAGGAGGGPAGERGAQMPPGALQRGRGAAGPRAPDIQQLYRVTGRPPQGPRGPQGPPAGPSPDGAA
jgi:hypothetical protein